MLDAALAYAQRGWAVFPCKIDKSPLTIHGYKDASVDSKTIARWWTLHTDASIGIATGAVSNLVVLDVDPDHGGEKSFTMLESEHGNLPHTIECLTGGGGRHIYFNHPGQTIPNSAGKLGTGLDIRGDGGYVIAPPSSHPGGRTYEWELLHHPDENDPADLPLWMFKLLVIPSAGPTAAPTEAITEGARNDTLFKLGCSMRGRGFPEHAIHAALGSMNTEQCQPPLDANEVASIAASAARYDPDQPTATQQDTNPAVRELLSNFFGLPVKKLIQQGIAEAHYSVQFGDFLVPIGNASKFLSQNTWRELVVSHGVVPFARQKDASWARIIGQLLKLVELEDADIGTADWLRDCLSQYSDKALSWSGAPDQDESILTQNLPFWREHLLYIHAGHFQQWLSLTRQGNISRGLMMACLRSLQWQRDTVRCNGLNRSYWFGDLSTTD